MYAKNVCAMIVGLLLCLLCVVSLTTVASEVEGGGFEGWDGTIEVDTTEGEGFEGFDLELTVAVNEQPSHTKEIHDPEGDMAEEISYYTAIQYRTDNNIHLSG